MGNRLQGHNYGYTEARKNLPEKNPSGEKMAHTQSSWQPVLRGFTVKENKFSN